MINIDTYDADHVSGWLTGKERAVSIAVNGAEAGSAVIGFPRPDVAKEWPGEPNAALSGFRYVFRGHEFRLGRNSIHVVATSDGVRTEWSGEVVRATQGALPLSSNKTSLPPDLCPLLTALLGQSFLARNFLEDDVEAEAIDAIIFAIRHGSRYDRPLWKYVSYITRLWLQFVLIQRQFPIFNLLSRFIDDTEYAPYNAADVYCIASHPFSMLALASHLYVLKQHNLRGRVFEFGCFKGYSTCCISLACRELGLRLATFDSFAGLPGVGAHAPGGYKGAFEEVTGNVETRGAPEVVVFYKGFFADSLKEFPPEPVFSIFMDVDFETSAVDLAKVIPWMERKGAVFSDETYPDNFIQGKVFMEKGDIAVLPPILDKFSALGYAVRGRHLYHNLGTLWEAEEGVPVLSTAGLRRIMEAALPQSLSDFQIGAE